MPAFGPEYTARKLSMPLGELDPASVEVGPEMATPTISVDRALGHLLKAVDVNLPAVNDFYNDLPLENKVDLNRLHIHLSVAAPQEVTTDTSTQGQFLGYGTKHTDRSFRKLIPELPPTTDPTVIVFLGNYLLAPEDGKKPKPCTSADFHDETIAMFITETIAHELVHLAQLDPAVVEKSPTVREKAVHKTKLTALKGLQVAIASKSDLITGVGTGVLTEAATHAGAGSVIVGAGSAGLAFLLHNGDRRERRLRSGYESYREQEHEEEAREHELAAEDDLCSVELLDEVILPIGYDALSFIKPTDKRAQRWVANDKHKNLAMTPRGGNPREIEKRANKSALRASLKEFKAIKQKPLLKRK